MHARLNQALCTLALVGLSFGGVATARQKPGDAPRPGTPPSAAMAEFNERLGRYLALHKQAAQKSAPPKQSNDIAKITVAGDMLAATIQSLRKDARPGDIFTPAVRAEFRQRMSAELKGRRGQVTKDELKEDAPAAVPFKVNAKYPDQAALPTMPTNLLLKLPVLPKEVEYRIIGTHLILRDVDANLIVDFIPNAIH